MNNYQIILDFIAGVDKNSIERVKKDVEKAMTNIAPKIGLDEENMKKSLDQFNKLLNLSEAEINDMQKALNNISLSDNLEQDLKTLVANIDKLDTNDLEQAFTDLNKIDLTELSNELNKIADSENWNDSVKNLANQYDVINRELTELSKTQSKALLQMKASGQEGSEAYNRLEKEIEETENQLKSLNKTTKISATEFEKVGDVKVNTKSLSEKMASFGMISEGFINLSQSLSTITEPFLALDTATNRIKTLQGAAKDLAPTFRNMALEMSKDYPINAAALQTSTYDALSAGINATEEDISAFMGAAAKLAVGGQEEIGNTVNLLSSMVNAYGESAQKTTEYSDILFTTVNLGKTTIPELSASLSHVVPNAAAMGFSLRDVGASLALMTANGIPTAQAATKLNQLLVEMQKPTANLAKAFDAAGISSESLGAKVKSGDTIGALKDMQAAFEKAGITATQAFGSTEASAAFNVLTKDMGKLSSVMQGFDGAAGTTDKAFKDMSESMQNRIASLKSKIETGFIGIADSMGVIGEFGVLGVQSLSQMTPYITAITGMNTVFSSVIPNIAAMGKGLITKLVPGLIVAEGEQTKLNLKILMNPYVIAAAGIAAMVVGLHALTGALHETAVERESELQAETKALSTQIATTEKQKELVANKLNLIDSFEKEGNAAMNNADLLLRLSKAYPGAIDATKSFDENLKNLKTRSADVKDELLNLNESLAEMQMDKIQLDFNLKKAKVNIDKEEIENQLTDAFSVLGLTDATEWLFGTSTARVDAENLIKPYTDAIYKASNSDELQKAGLEMQMAIWNNPKFAELDEAEKALAVEKVQKMVESQADVIDARNEKLAQESVQLASQVTSGIKTESQALEYLKKNYKLSEEKARELLTAQKSNTTEAGNTAQKVKDIAGAFKNAKEDAGNLFSGSFNSLLDIQIRTKEIDKEIKGLNKVTDAEKIKTLENEKKGLLANYDIEFKKAKESKKNANELENIEKKLTAQFETKTKEAVNYYDIINKEFDKSNKIVERSQKEFDLEQQKLILSEQREKNNYDDYLNTEKQIENLKLKTSNLIEILKKQNIEVFQNGKELELTFPKSISKENQQQINDFVQDFLYNTQNDIDNKQIDLQEITIEVSADLTKAESDLKQIELEKIKLEIELGDYDASKIDGIASFYQNLKNQAISELEEITKKVQEAENAMANELVTAGTDQNLINIIKTKYTTQISELKNKSVDLSKEISVNQKEIDNIYKDSYEARLKQIDSWYSEETKKLEQQQNAVVNLQSFLTTLADNNNSNLDKTKDLNLSNLEAQQQNELAMIENYSKLKIMSVEDTEKRKNDIEQRYANERSKIEEDIENKKQLLKQQNDAYMLLMTDKTNQEQAKLDILLNEKKLEAFNQRLEDEKAGKITISADEKKEAEKLRKEIEDKNKIIQAGGAETQLIVDTLSSSIGESFEDIFGGEDIGDSLLKGARKVFAVLKGIIQKEITAFVLRLVLSEGNLKYLAALPFPLNVLAIPVITAGITGAVKGITDPLLAKLNFASGGVVDNETLIKVGDASKLGGENKEWIFRNDQLKTLIASIAGYSNRQVENKLDILIDTLNNQNLEARLKGEDLYLSIKRTQIKMNNRSY